MIESKYGLKYSMPHSLVHIVDNSAYTGNNQVINADDPSLFSAIVVSGAPMGEDNKVVTLTRSDIPGVAYGMNNLSVTDIEKYGQSILYVNSLIEQGAPVRFMRITPEGSTYGVSTIVVQYRIDDTDGLFHVRFKEVGIPSELQLDKFANGTRLHSALVKYYNNDDVVDEEGKAWVQRVFITNISAGRGSAYNNMSCCINPTSQPKKPANIKYEFVTIDARTGETVERFFASLVNIDNSNRPEEMAKMENAELEAEVVKLEDEIKILMLPKDPNDDKDIIMEIRGAAGGDEASLFAGDLLRMYEKYAEKQGWNVSVVDSEQTEVGGYKRVTIMITGDKVYSKLKYENGAHRVQRIPVTESAGRVHTSTATVAVMPEYEQVDLELDPKDIRVDVYRSSGAGGQHINKTSSAVRMTHLPTGIVVAMQDQRSQQQNRAKAMEILKSRVYDFYESQNRDKYDEKRKSAVGTGDRSERIRTYNYPQNRVTDHRIGLTINKLDRVMDGDLDEIIDALTVYYQTKQLEELADNA